MVKSLLTQTVKGMAAMRKAVALSLLSCCAYLCIHAGGLMAAPSSPRLLQSLRPSHPRLMATASELERVQQMVQSEPLAHAWYAELRAKAEKMLDEPTVVYKLIGPRLLAQSRRCLERVYTLGLLYRLDGDKRFAERAKQELFAAAAFKDWNPSHFLDVAEMTHALGIGYDWLFDVLSVEERATMRTAIIEKGLKPSFVDTLPNGARGYNWWLTVTHNWNQVCNGGLTVGALAIADEEPELAERVIRRALDSIKLPMGSYAPDGGWDEGPAYWHYATSYTVYFLAAMATALGSDLAERQALLRMPGFAVTGDFRVHAIGPLGRAFNYADANDRAEAAPELFWLARQFNRPLWAWHERQRSGTPHPIDLLWFDSRGDGAQADNMPLDAFFRGIDVAFFRSAWEDPQALYVGFKGGNNKANHSHLDLGTFVLDALGYRWAVDLGSDNYNLPAYFGKQRWTYYRLKTAGHNTLLINGVNQEASARAPIIAFHATSAWAFAVADLTAAYPMTQRLWRGVAILDRERVLIEDEIEAERPVDIVWSMHTPAAISIDGASAVLKQGTEAVQAKIVAPAGATFEAASATPSTPDENQNEGIHKLVVRLPDKTKQARIAIVIETNKGSTKPLTAAPLAEWVSTTKR
jgi:hypothetical protein